jgi:hypothetical protein
MIVTAGEIDLRLIDIINMCLFYYYNDLKTYNNFLYSTKEKVCDRNYDFFWNFLTHCMISLDMTNQIEKKMSNVRCHALFIFC